MKPQTALIMLATAALTGCGTPSSKPPATQLTLPAVDVQPLVGDWRGEYVADGPGGRHGSLSFTLVSGDRDAHGALTMTAAGADRAYERYRSEQNVVTSADTAPRVEPPAIQFVRLSGSIVSGTVDAYLDPQCQCPAVMTLNGDLHGDTIDGTFRATYDAKMPDLIGTWTVKRATTR